MDNPVVLSACRTPVGKFHGAVSSMGATNLGAVAIRAAIEQSGVPVDDVDEVVMGLVLSAGIGMAPARQAALQAGLPPSVAAITINKMCGSGLKAVMLAAQAIRSGDAEVVVAGGMESMSQAPYLLDRSGPKLGDRKLVDSMLHDGLTCPFTKRSMVEVVEAQAKSDGIGRDEQDRYACESHRRAVEAQAQGKFDREIIPVAIPARSDSVEVKSDEGPRENVSMAELNKLRPVSAPDGCVTAGNSSMISDGAAALVVASRSYADAHQLEPLVEIVASATSGTEPGDLFVAPVPAIRKVLKIARMELTDVDLFEINEAFAAQMLACLQRLDLSEEHVNVLGGAIALGHPIGASGARVATTLIHELGRRQMQVSVASLCLGGGNAVACVFKAI